MTSVALRLRDALARRGRGWAAPVEHFEEIDSTNDQLKRRAREGAPEWTLVLADRQTAGRGRSGRRWVSPAGGLYLSALLRPRGAPREAALIPLAAGIAVCDALREASVDARVKWPNDVLVAGRKIAGILAEAVSGPTRTESVVVGIGVNLGSAPRLPRGAGEGATSVAREAGRAPEPAELAAAILAGMALWYDALARGEGRGVCDAWRARSVSWWGRLVEVESGKDRVRGVARDIDSTGALLLEVDGRLLPVLSGEARELRLAPGDRTPGTPPESP
jgi:BirA family transcriptional regulator, biotin operon repressor / biotin---[acetyl-CoA-carboxylase] ligase